MMLTSEEHQINVMIVNDSPFMIEMLKELVTRDSTNKSFIHCT